MINGIMMNMLMMIVKILMIMMLTMMIVFTSAVWLHNLILKNSWSSSIVIPGIIGNMNKIQSCYRSFAILYQLWFEIFTVFIGIGNPEPKTIPIFEGLTEEQASFQYNIHIYHPLHIYSIKFLNKDFFGCRSRKNLHQRFYTLFKCYHIIHSSHLSEP